MEWEHSSNVLDVSFIPDSLTLNGNDRKPRDVATSAPEHYQPPEFVTSARQQSKVRRDPLCSVVIRCAPF